MLVSGVVHAFAVLLCMPFLPSQHAFLLRPLPVQASSTLLNLSSESSPESPFAKACAAFEKAHAEDPRTITVKDDETGENVTLPYSVHYHRRMAHWLNQLEDDPPEVVKLAVRTQHIRRWTRPRSDYPTGLAGYKKWRTDLQKFHAQQAGEILLASGYTEEMANRLGEVLCKKNLASDPDVQLLEDVICVTFLENEYGAFIEKQEQEHTEFDDDDKLVAIVQKTWGKMTPRGHEAALSLAGQLSERGLSIVQTALEG